MCNGEFTARREESESGVEKGGARAPDFEFRAFSLLYPNGIDIPPQRHAVVVASSVLHRACQLAVAEPAIDLDLFIAIASQALWNRGSVRREAICVAGPRLMGVGEAAIAHPPGPGSLPATLHPAILGTLYAAAGALRTAAAARCTAAGG